MTWIYDMRLFGGWKKIRTCSYPNGGASHGDASHGRKLKEHLKQTQVFWRSSANKNPIPPRLLKRNSWCLVPNFWAGRAASHFGCSKLLTQPCGMNWIDSFICWWQIVPMKNSEITMATLGLLLKVKMFKWVTCKISLYKLKGAKGIRLS